MHNFILEQTLQSIKEILSTNSNHSDAEYLQELKKEIEEQLERNKKGD